MSSKERERLIVMHQYENGEIPLKGAAWNMCVSERQAIRIKKGLEQSGAQGLIHPSRVMTQTRYEPFDGKHHDTIYVSPAGCGLSLGTSTLYKSSYHKSTDIDTFLLPFLPSPCKMTAGEGLGSGGGSAAQHGGCACGGFADGAFAGDREEAA
ncbi:MAG: hypothetical protein ACOCVL_00670 [Candidatus Sumerlaeota bacterium]